MRPDVALVLLAAGHASRFGGGKLLARLDGKPLVEWAMEAAEAAGFTRKIVVCRPGDGIVEREGWTRVENPDADLGLSTSIRCGVAAVEDATRIVITLADMPFVDPDHLSRLGKGSGVEFTAYPNDKRGCPAAFPPSAYPALRALEGDRGAASLDLPDVRLVAPSDPATLRDIDTPRDLAAASQTAARETIPAANR